MKFPLRSFLHLAAGAAALPATSRIARAQTYPTRPVRIIVGVAAGGAADNLARLIGQWLSERLGQPFIIEIRPGAGSNTATEMVVRAAPDGHTLLVAGPASAINATLYEARVGARSHTSAPAALTRPTEGQPSSRPEAARSVSCCGRRRSARRLLRFRSASVRPQRPAIFGSSRVDALGLRGERESPLLESESPSPAPLLFFAITGT
jgi:hypothetical protein